MSSRLDAAVVELAAALREELRAAATPVAAAPDRLLSIDQASALLGFGRSRLYDEIHAGRVRSVKAGHRRLIPASAVSQYVTGAAME